jgi:hypothetical protein
MNLKFVNYYHISLKDCKESNGGEGEIRRFSPPRFLLTNIFQLLSLLVLTRTIYCGLTLATPHHIVARRQNIGTSLSY